MPTLYEGYSIDGPNSGKEIGHTRASVMKHRFLECYMHTANVTKACAILGLVPRTVYHWKHNDPQFMEDFVMADRVALGTLEDEATRRAIDGTEKPVFQGGRLVGYTREYSDTLLIVLLKARSPSKYKERFSGELTGADGKPLMPDMKITHVHTNVPLAQTEDSVLQERIENKDIIIEDIKHEELDEL